MRCQPLSSDCSHLKITQRNVGILENVPTGSPQAALDQDCTHKLFAPFLTTQKTASLGENFASSVN